MTINQLTPNQLKAKLDANEILVLLDVREPFEFDYAHIDGSVLMPLNDVPARLQELDRSQEIVVICHHGVRSQMAAGYLVDAGFGRVSNLTGGIDAWSLTCDPSVKRY
jgi:rhodanese-related sulfurtransferase